MKNPKMSLITITSGFILSYFFNGFDLWKGNGRNNGLEADFGDQSQDKI
jgi:hypothetical protein